MPDQSGGTGAYTHIGKSVGEAGGRGRGGTAGKLPFPLNAIRLREVVGRRGLARGREAHWTRGKEGVEEEASVSMSCFSIGPISKEGAGAVVRGRGVG